MVGICVQSVRGLLPCCWGSAVGKICRPCLAPGLSRRLSASARWSPAAVLRAACGFGVGCQPTPWFSAAASVFAGCGVRFLFPWWVDRLGLAGSG